MIETVLFIAWALIALAGGIRVFYGLLPERRERFDPAPEQWDGVE
jgi:hypothetical protein